MTQPALLFGNKRMTKGVDFARVRDTKKYAPKPINSMADFKGAVAELVGKKAGIFFGSDKRFVTFGSCFATNIAEHLRLRNGRVYTTCITEDVNSPFNNMAVLRRVFLKENCFFTGRLREVTAVDYEELEKEFKGATDIIFTLGNVFHLFGGDVVATKDTTLVRETYQETVDYIREIVLLLRTHTSANVFVSVSPVPISGYRGHEFLTAIEADCASKCQLVAAVRILSGFTYIPTFEIFRWLSAHQSFPTFGEDEGAARHIFRDQIATVMGVLC